MQKQEPENNHNKPTMTLRVPLRMDHTEAIKSSVTTVCSSVINHIINDDKSELMDAWIEAGCPVTATPIALYLRRTVRLTSDTTRNSEEIFFLNPRPETKEPKSALQLRIFKEINTKQAIEGSVHVAVKQWLLPLLTQAPESVIEWHRNGGYTHVTFDDKPGIQLADTS